MNDFYERMRECREAPPLHTKDEARALIEKQTREFLRRGGCIERVPSGLVTPPGNLMVRAGLATDEAHAERIKQNARRASVEFRRTVATSSDIGVQGAAEILGIHRNVIYGMMRRGEGPPFERKGRLQTFWRIDRQVLIQWGREHGYEVREDAA